MNESHLHQLTTWPIILLPTPTTYTTTKERDAFKIYAYALISRMVTIISSLMSHNSISLNFIAVKVRNSFIY